MPKALSITRLDLTAEQLREAAARSTDADAARRMLALALVLEGYPRGEAANLCGERKQNPAAPEGRKAKGFCSEAWTAKPFATGLSATMPRALGGCPIASHPALNRASLRSRKLPSPSWFATGRILP